MGLHTGVDKLDRYGWRKTVSSKGGDILNGNFSLFDDAYKGVDKLNQYAVRMATN